MGDRVERRGWYDGWFYARLIDSDFTSFRNRIFKYIEPGKKIIDVGCGTGGFTLKLAKFSRSVLGIDISQKQIDIAQKRFSKSGAGNVEFKTTSATDMKRMVNDKFDYAILTFVIHEVSPSERRDILSQVKDLAGKIVILDFHHPMARNFSGYSIRLTEFLAGKDHYTNFLDFNYRGGLLPLLEEAGFEIIRDRINGPKVFRTIVASQKSKS